MDLKRAVDILEIKKELSKEVIRHAYKDLVQVWHPDRYAAKPHLFHRAQEKMKEINAAYEFLLNYIENDSKREPQPTFIVCPNCSVKNIIKNLYMTQVIKCGKCGFILWDPSAKEKNRTDDINGGMPCGDGRCIGHIDSKGLYSKCGLSYKEAKAAERRG